MMQRLALAPVATVVCPFILALTAVAAEEPIRLDILLTYAGSSASFARS